MVAHHDHDGSGTDPPVSGGAVVVAGRTLPLTELLAGCLRTLRGAPPGDPALADAQRAFLAGGLGALTDTPDREWVQVGLVPRADARTALYGLVSDIAHELLDRGLATNFFFMHKPPGLRVRFQAAPDRYEETRRRILGWSEELRGHSGVATVLPAVYEPEANLFGGPASMRHVHDLFTVDSLAWLAVHGRDGPEPASTWAVSLLMLRAVFEGLGVEGCEHWDVWDRVRTETGRRLSTQARTAAGVDDAAPRLRRLWDAPDVLLGLLPGWAQRVVERHRGEALSVAHGWRSEYFQTRQACVGPRRAAAFYVVFHWNRAGLPAARQVLLAETLATPAEVEGGAA
ncbi:hypothetical protein GCM10012275_00850 [Longimycelium tulufanense]|uniref:Thiopeptide-type bacteriocin biosynthesis domain-containing protein n=1 Tax=Longimycelium tulufanense TaxID=907463 RepID=A0A8J3C9A8_9PSEU|nr:thiopeptide-type bacteriocin biosynthesis protein [Longimycelium tulufanense]GGM33213.1 hypothetical protein GCM10012275_00850 [Longimycelium tulufanense]